MKKKHNQTTKKSQKSPKIFEISITGTSKVRVINNIRNRLKDGKKTIIYTPNPEILLLSRQYPLLKEALQTSGINVADGIGLKWALMLKGYSTDLIKGRKLMNEILEIAADYKYSVYFLGASKIANKKAIANIKKKFKNLKIDGDSGPWVNDKGETDNKKDSNLHKDIVDKIKRQKPDILFVAFGAPKQEVWINKYKDELPAKLFIGVGGSVNYIAGESKPVPIIMEKLALEWLWRLATEPNRFPRIVNAVIVFPMNVMFEEMGQYKIKK